MAVAGELAWIRAQGDLLEKRSRTRTLEMAGLVLEADPESGPATRGPAEDPEGDAR